ncbi:unnamed protein product [Calypogeia fissa]
MADVMVDLPAVVHSHCLFFDNLVELIPAKFYVPNEEPSDTWTFKKNKAARLAAKITTKENLKKAKRNRLDPDKFKSTLQVLQEKKTESEKTVDAEAEDIVPVKAPATVDRAVTYDDLRERLHKRIEMLRSKRHAETAAAATSNARNFQNEKKKESLKRRLMKTAPKEQGTMPTVTTQEQPPKRQKVDEQAVKKKPKEPEVDPAELEFSRVKMGLENSVVGLGRKRRKETKEDLLEKAIKLQEKMQDPEKGGEVITKHSWSSAVSRAAGEKVLDNPKLLKNSMKREQQQKVKSSKKWKERKALEKKASSEKQKTRKENISQRIQSSKERAIAKREKKLMRPGFEGRKAGFINTGSSS